MRLHPSIHCSLALILLALTAQGNPGERITFRTRDGHSFNDVTVARVVGRKLEVNTPKGAQSVRYEQLPLDLQERFFHPSMLHPPKIGDHLEFKTLNGRAYNGPLREIAPTGISIGTPDGVDKVPYANLPPELANTFPYDAEDAARYEAAHRAQRQRAAVARQAAEKKEADQRAAAAKAATRSQPTRPSSNESALGNRGAKSLGTPKLGGSGLGK